MGPNLRSLELQSCIVSTSQASINCGILSGDVPHSAHISSSEQTDFCFYFMALCSLPSSSGKTEQPFLLLSESHTAVTNILYSCIACFAPAVFSVEIKKKRRARIRRHLLICSVHPLSTGCHFDRLRPKQPVKFQGRSAETLPREETAYVEG